jgi:hypothetical protein
MNTITVWWRGGTTTTTTTTTTNNNDEITTNNNQPSPLDNNTNESTNNQNLNSNNDTNIPRTSSLSSTDSATFHDVEVPNIDIFSLEQDGNPVPLSIRGVRLVVPLCTFSVRGFMWLKPRALDVLCLEDLPTTCVEAVRSLVPPSTNCLDPSELECVVESGGLTISTYSPMTLLQMLYQKIIKEWNDFKESYVQNCTTLDLAAEELKKKKKIIRQQKIENKSSSHTIIGSSKQPPGFISSELSSSEEQQQQQQRKRKTTITSSSSPIPTTNHTMTLNNNSNNNPPSNNNNNNNLDDLNSVAQSSVNNIQALLHREKNAQLTKKLAKTMIGKSIDGMLNCSAKFAQASSKIPDTLLSTTNLYRVMAVNQVLLAHGWRLTFIRTKRQVLGSVIISFRIEILHYTPGGFTTQDEEELQCDLKIIEMHDADDDEEGDDELKSEDDDPLPKTNNDEETPSPVPPSLPTFGAKIKSPSAIGLTRVFRLSFEDALRLQDSKSNSWNPANSLRTLRSISESSGDLLRRGSFLGNNNTGESSSKRSLQQENNGVNNITTTNGDIALL